MAKSKKDKKGWVAISRSIQQNFLWKSDKPFDDRSAWIDLILLANHEPGIFQTRQGEIIKIPVGSTFTSVRKLADRWHWSKEKVGRFLATLTEAQMVTQTATHSGTLVSLVKYRDFQGYRDTPQDTSQDTSQDTTSPRTTMIQQRETTMNNKRASARPVSMAETMEALKRWAEKGGVNG